MRRFESHGKHFTFQDLRRECGVDRRQDPSAWNKSWHWWKGLENEGVIALVPDPGRKRNRYYKIADPERLDAALSPGFVSSIGRDASNSSPSNRLSRLEAQVRNVAARMEELEEKMDELLAVRK